MRSDDERHLHEPESTGELAWLLPLGFVVLAGLLMFLGDAPIPLTQGLAVDRSALEPGPRRVAMSDPPHTRIDDRVQRCHGCHLVIGSARVTPDSPRYHQTIHLRHGMNDNCTNCHNPEDSERLVLRSGEGLAFAEAPRLCAQCHGTTYRDWQRGTHGKTLGSWVTGSEDQRRLRCNECHDPHAPRYSPMMPLPKPNTLRMGDQQQHADHAASGEASPLQHWFREKGSDPHRGPSSPGGHP